MHKEGGEAGEAGEETEKLKEPPEAWKLREGRQAWGLYARVLFSVGLNPGANSLIRCMTLYLRGSRSSASVSSVLPRATD